MYRGAVVGIAALAAALALLGQSSIAMGHDRHGRIRHIVVLYQENHSFDNVLGRLCARIDRCDGSLTGRLPNGSPIPLATSPDVVPIAGHTGAFQEMAINGGRMDGWARINGCSAAEDYACLTQYRPRQIPNLSRLARHFALSDRTFYMDNVSTWGAHLELVAGTLDGFTGDHVPVPSDDTSPNHPGWGCDSGMDTDWRPFPGGPISSQPTCVPDYSLDPVRYPYGGAYRSTKVKHVPTLMDRLDQAGRSWKLYAPAAPGSGGYGLSICPTFAGCLYTEQHRSLVEQREVLEDATRGRLPNFSIVIPNWPISQHNGESMAIGDNWIGKVVEAIEYGPDWRSTAILIAYDDCGCFYDHVPPPDGLGIRTPMVIVSPWAKAHTTDSRVTSIASVLAFAERTFHLPPLTSEDAGAYSYRRAFDLHQRPLKPIPMTKTNVPRPKRERLIARGRPPGMT
jgi:phospholipase C